MSAGGEFEYIARRLAPLSRGASGAAGLTDDGAVLSPPPGQELAVTADALVEGVHFPEGEDPALAARKALRVNLSDLAAMGAAPLAYMTSVVWPRDGFQARAEGFADGLALDQEKYGVCLIGGDTTSGPGPWVIAVTAFGLLPAGKAVRRSAARTGDFLVVTGEIGAAWLGLKQREAGLKPGDPGFEPVFEQSFTLPEPRIALAGAVRDYANAAIDVSDGLLADARHIAAASGLGVGIDLDAMPVAAAASAWLDRQDSRSEALLALASGGDDYELALGICPDRLEGFEAACREAGVRCTVIGRFEAGEREITVRGEGRALDPERFGFTHF